MLCLPLCPAAAQQELRDAAVTAWVPDASLGRGGKTRDVTYVRPLSIPLMPKQCNVKEVHSVGRSAGGIRGGETFPERGLKLPHRAGFEEGARSAGCFIALCCMESKRPC